MKTLLGTTLSADTIDSLLIQKPSATTTRSKDLVLASLKKQGIKSIACEGDMHVTLETGVVQTMPVMRYVLASLGSVDRIDRLLQGHCGQQFVFSDAQHLLEDMPKTVTASHKAQLDLSESEKTLWPLADDVVSLRRSILETRIKELQAELQALSVSDRLATLVDLAQQDKETFMALAPETSYTSKGLLKVYEEYQVALKAEHSYRFTAELARKGLLYAVMKATVGEKTFPYFPKDQIDGIDDMPFDTLGLALKGDFQHLETVQWKHWQVLSVQYIELFGMTSLIVRPII